MEQELPLAEVAVQGGPSKPEAEHCATNEGYQAVDDATDWNGVLQKIARAPSTAELQESLQVLHQYVVVQQQHQTASSSSSETTVPHEADRPLAWQLAAVIRQLQLQQRQAPDDALLPSILLCILECLYGLWSRSSNAARTSNGVDILSWLLTAWQLQLFPLSGERGGVETALTRPQKIMTVTVRILSLLAKQQRDTKQHLMKQAVMVVSLIVQTVQITAVASAYDSRHEEKKSEDAVLLQVDGDQVLELTEALFAFIKELTLRAAIKDQMYLYEQLLDTVLAYSSSLRNPVVEAATGTLWNWAVSLPLNMAANPKVWSTVQCLWNENGDRASDNTILRNLSAIVGTMVASASTADESSSTQEEEAAVARIHEQAWLVPSLVKALDGAHATDNSDHRRRCMRTIRCLAVTEWGRIFLWNYVDANSFGNMLVQILRSEGESCIDTCILACQTLTFLLPSLPADMVELWPCLETTLIAIIENVDIAVADKLVLAASQALTVNLKSSPWKRGAGCFSTEFFDQILDVLQECVDQPAYHAGFSELFLQLVASEGKNIETSTRIKGISPLLVSFPAVLETMAILLSPLAAGPEFDSSRSDTIKILTALVNDNDRNKKPMADDENLLTALVNVCLMTNNEGPLKDDAKQLILTLVPEL